MAQPPTPVDSAPLGNITNPTEDVVYFISRQGAHSVWSPPDSSKAWGWGYSRLPPLSVVDNLPPAVTAWPWAPLAPKRSCDPTCPHKILSLVGCVNAAQQQLRRLSLTKMLEFQLPHFCAFCASILCNLTKNRLFRYLSLLLPACLPTINVRVSEDAAVSKNIHAHEEGKWSNTAQKWIDPFCFDRCIL